MYEWKRLAQVLLVSIGPFVWVISPGSAQANLGDNSRRLVPRTAFEGPTLRFDFPGLEVGVAEYEEGPTGVTVFRFPGRVTAAVDVRGGAPGTLNTDALRLGYTNRMIDAVVFAGGSWNGLAAATGVADEIRQRGAGTNEPPPIVGVVAAIVNDLAGARRFSGITPDDRLGRAAAGAARPGAFPLGARGAGRFVMMGSALGQHEPSGQGGAFRMIGPTRVAVFTVVNAGGFIIGRDGKIARCRSEHFDDPCSQVVDLLRRRVDAIAARAASDSGPGRGSLGGVELSATDNTTITLVATNEKMEWWALQRLAVQVHASMARAIQPFATAGDGDVLYAVTTGEVENPQLSPFELGLVASELAWDAVLSSLPAAEAVGPVTRIHIDPAAMAVYAGQYELGPGTRFTVRIQDGHLEVQAGRTGILYVPNERWASTVPVARDEFLLDTPRRDRLRFERDAHGAITGLRINPGSWSIPGRRVQ